MISNELRKLCVGLRAQLHKQMTSEDIEVANRSIDGILAEAERVAALEDQVVLSEAE